VRASGAMINISRETLRQSFIQELQNRGINETSEGEKIETLDYHSLRREVTIARYRETNVDSSSNAWF